jgi:hypothetical protein
MNVQPNQTVLNANNSSRFILNRFNLKWFQ